MLHLPLDKNNSLCTLCHLSFQCRMRMCNIYMFILECGYNHEFEMFKKCLIALAANKIPLEAHVIVAQLDEAYVTCGVYVLLLCVRACVRAFGHVCKRFKWLKSNN